MVGIERHFDSGRTSQALNWTHDEHSIVDKIRMGILDLGPEHRSNNALVRSMRYLAVLADRLWSVIETERSRVCVLIILTLPILTYCIDQGDGLE